MISKTRVGSYKQTQRAPERAISAFVFQGMREKGYSYFSAATGTIVAARRAG